MHLQWHLHVQSRRLQWRPRRWQRQWQKPAASKPSSPEPQEAKPAKSAAVATPARSKTVASSSKTSTKVATIGDTPTEAKARIVLLFAAFIIGVLMGKYVL